MNKIYLFAYGSMKQGFRNHLRLENDKFIGKAITVEKYNMYPAESFNYPYGIENERKWQLHGDLFELTSTDISEIDIFEGTPDYYYRKEIDVVCNDTTYSAFVYFRNSQNPTGMDTDISLDEWTQEFEFVGIKNNEFLEALKLALIKKNKVTKDSEEFILSLKEALVEDERKNNFLKRAKEAGLKIVDSKVIINPFDNIIKKSFKISEDDRKYISFIDKKIAI